jgi:LDH2 family malate/lactate/ureidoglycolate dehydrogenase
MARAAGVSTTSVAIEVPGGDHGPVGLDTRTGVVSVGMLSQARRTGQAIPKGRALNTNCNPTTDPQAA